MEANNKDVDQNVHQDNMSMCFIPPYTPLLYSKIGVYRGRHNFLIFALVHRLWVLVSLSEAVLMCSHDLCFEQKQEKYHNFHLKIIVFTAVKYCSILHRHVFVMSKTFRNSIFRLPINETDLM